MNMLKRVTAWILVFALLFSYVPAETAAAAVDTDSTAGTEQPGTEPAAETAPSAPTEETEAPVPVPEENMTLPEDLSTLPQPGDYDPAVDASDYETTIMGVVQDGNGKGLPDVAVTVYDMTNGEYLYTQCHTDDAGTWQISDAWIGDTYLIAYYKAGYTMRVNNLSCTASVGGVVLETVIADEIPGLVCNAADFTYTTDTINGVATITGYTGSDTGIILPSELGGYPVTSVRSEAFYGNITLERVAFSESITSLGNSAFEDCTKLKELYFPNRLTSIGSYAFLNCTGLTEVVLPDSVMDIGASVFNGCTNLSSIQLPLSWSSANGSIFYNCSSLTEITVPEGMTALPANAFNNANYLVTIHLPESLTTIGNSAFVYCVRLKDVELPDGVTTIGNSGFENCTSLTQMQLPASLTSLGSYAFYGCTGLTAVSMPDSVTSMGAGVFNGCKNLSSINIPASWSSSNGSIFYNCSSLTEITVPEGMTALPANAFNNANYLKKVNLPDSLVTIGQSAFESCVRLRYVNSSFASLTTIGSYAFYGCERLRALILPEDVTNLGAQIFGNCPMLTVFCPEHSYTAVYMIDGEVDFALIGKFFQDSDAYALDRSGTYYASNITGAQANGYVTMNVAYKFKSSAAGNVSNLKLIVRIPTDMTLIEKTVMLDGVRQVGYDFEENTLTLHVTNTSGQLSFCLNPTKDSNVATYALMRYSQNGSEKEEIIGVLNDSVSLLSVEADAEVTTNRFTVRGVGPADSDVSVYLDGTLQATVHTNKVGSYSAQVSISNPKNYQTYTVMVQSTTAEGISVASQKVRYCDTAPAVSHFTMQYDGNSYNLLDQSVVKPTVTMETNELFEFYVKFDNPEQVDRVYVCSTKSNVTKRIEAVWNEAAQAFMAKGLFDPSNTSYLPGTITVEYSQTREPVSFQNGSIDYTSDKYVNGASDPIRAALAGKLEECIEELVSDDKQLSGIIKLVDVDAQLDFNILTDIIPSYLDPNNAGEYGYEVMEDDYGAKLYLKVAEYAEDEIRGEIIDFTQEKITEFCIKGGYIDLDTTVASYFTFVDALGYADKLVTWDNNRISLDESRQAILSSNMSDAQKAEALKKLDYASKANNGVVAAMALQVILSMAGIAIPFPASMILPLLAMQNENYVNGFLGQFGHLKASQKGGSKISFRWVIDPSGYVYDAVSQERLQGVVTTAYCIAYDESADFWDSAPAETEYGTVWNALEYDQANPLVTDSQGRYAWDVPEGWWRVKYERFGYETTWSEWLPVPPPQTQVNIGMTPITDIGNILFTAGSSPYAGETMTVDYGKMAQQDAALNAALQAGELEILWHVGGMHRPDRATGQLGESIALSEEDLGKELYVVLKTGSKTMSSELFTVSACHSVTFVVDGKNVAVQKVENGKTAVKPEDPVKNGSKFLGWYTEDGKEYDFAAPVTGDITLNAKFEITIPVPAKPYKIANVVSGVHVYWKATEGAAKYGLWRSETGKDGTYKWLANPTVPHFTDTKVESGKTYYYKVTAMNAAGVHSDKSEAIGITYVFTPDITSRTNIAAGVKLGWEKIEGATGYAIYRKSYSGTDAWVRVGTISGNSTFTWTDTSVKNNNGTIYKYTIRALAGSDMKTLSGCRNAGRTMARLSSQVMTSAAKASATSIKCQWTTSSRVTGYEVRFMVGNTVYKTFTVGNYKTGVKTFTGLKAGQTYTIQVRTYLKVDGMGFYSDWSTAKTVAL